MTMVTQRSTGEIMREQHDPGAGQHLDSSAGTEILLPQICCCRSEYAAAGIGDRSWRRTA